MSIASFHWWYSQGHTYLYASSDGKNWTKIAEAAPPEEGKATWGGFDGELPESLLHKKNLHLKVVMYSYGEKAPYGGAYTNTAQHSRYQHGSDVPVFELGVEFDDTWLIVQRITTTVINENGITRTIKGFMPGQSSKVEVDIVNPTKDSINARLTLYIYTGKDENSKKKIVSQSDQVLKPNQTTSTSIVVQIPLDISVLENSETCLYMTLHDRTTNEKLDDELGFVKLFIIHENLGAVYLLLLLK